MSDFEHKDNVSMTAIITTLEMMNKKLDKIDTGLHDKGGLCDRVSIVETKRDSTQSELEEHKNNHWQFATLVIAGAGVLATLAAVIIPLLFHAPQVSQVIPH